MSVLRVGAVGGLKIAMYPSERICMASFYVRKLKRGWGLMEQSYVDKKSIQTPVTPDAFKALGFDPSWSIDLAKKRAKELNSSNLLQRSQQRSITKSAARVRDKLISSSHWLPISDVTEFEGYLKMTNMGSPEHFEKRMIMWDTAQKIITHMSIDPRVYSDYCKGFFNYFISKNYSPDYCNKLLAIINQWGMFYSKRRNTSFEPIRYPSAQEKEKIKQGYRKSKTCREGGSDRMTPQILEKIKSKLTEEHYQWVYVSLWFGLRPDEIELAQFTVYTDEIYKIRVLRIWAPKTQTYKFIPILYPEQSQAVSWLRPMKRPLNKTLKSATGNSRITAYGGRKGFEKLMTGKGESLTAISAWLGHTNLRTTKTYYEDQEKVVLSRKVD